MDDQKRIDELKEQMALAQIDGDELLHRYRVYSRIDEEAGLASIQERIATATDTEESPCTEAQLSTQRAARSSRNPSMLWRAAAVVVLLMVGGAFWYHHDYTKVTPPVVSEEIETAMRQSRESGRQAAEVVSIGAQHTAAITQEERTLYHVDNDFAEQLAEARRITTYQNKEYWVTLDDGTLVHLNDNSRLIYPEQFGDRRDVILDGEAYFMVAKDKSRQFVVHTPQGDVRVHGTAFMVNTRDGGKNDNANATGHLSMVLVKGSIGFTPNNGREQMLTPGQQLSVVNSQLSINEVDTTPYVAWNEGKFLFQAWPLERVMEVLSRWYGVEVSFASDELRTKQLDGYFSRYDGIDYILESIEAVLNVTITKNQHSISINK